MDLVAGLKNGIVAKEKQVQVESDETIPQRLHLMFIALLIVMAWRTSNILYLTFPHDYMGYILVGFTLMSVEGGSLFWHHAHGHAARGAEQQGAAMFGFLMDFLFSVVTTVADIALVSGIQAFDLEKLQPFALIASGLIVIANVGLYFFYDWNSPVKKAIRTAAQKDFDFAERMANETRESKEAEDSLDLHAKLLAKKEAHAVQALALAEREVALRAVLDKAERTSSKTAKRSQDEPVSLPVGSAALSGNAKDNGHGGGSPNA